MNISLINTTILRPDCGAMLGMTKNKFKHIGIALILIVVFQSCKSHQNDFLTWSDNIPPNTSIEAVRSSQPEFVIIDWNNPETLENGNQQFYITDIEGSQDVLKMGYYLEFDSLGFVSRFAQK